MNSIAQPGGSLKHKGIIKERENIPADQAVATHCPEWGQMCLFLIYWVK